MLTIYLRLRALYFALMGRFERSQRATYEWHAHVTAKRRQEAIAADDAAQSQLRQCDYAIKQFDQRERDARIGLATRGAR